MNTLGVRFVFEGSEFAAGLAEMSAAVGRLVGVVSECGVVFSETMAAALADQWGLEVESPDEASGMTLAALLGEIDEVLSE